MLEKQKAEKIGSKILNERKDIFQKNLSGKEHWSDNFSFVVLPRAKTTAGSVPRGLRGKRGGYPSVLSLVFMTQGSTFGRYCRQPSFMSTCKNTPPSRTAKKKKKKKD